MANGSLLGAKLRALRRREKISQAQLARQLGISPSYLNGFQVAVDLSLDTSGLSVKPSELSIYWYDPALEKWTDMHALADDSGQVLSQPLSHFSKYAGGKAGW